MTTRAKRGLEDLEKYGKLPSSTVMRSIAASRTIDRVLESGDDATDIGRLEKVVAVSLEAVERAGLLKMSGIFERQAVTQLLCSAITDHAAGVNLEEA